MLVQHIQQFIIYNISIEEKPLTIKLFNHNVNKIILKFFFRVEMSQRVKILRDIWYIFHKFKPAKKYGLVQFLNHHQYFILLINIHKSGEEMI